VTAGSTRPASYHPPVPSDSPFISFGGNAEDVVLHRALRDVASGRYVEIGADSPTDGSLTRALHDRGWSGLAIVSDEAAVEEFRRLRPGDTALRGSAADVGALLDEHLPAGGDLHVLAVSAAGAERDVLAGVDLARRRPWVLVVAASGPDAHDWESLVLDANYEFCLFDGVSRFYVAAECADRLRPALGSPANVADDFVPHRWHALEQELTATREELAEVRAAHEEAVEELVRWRGTVLARWSDAVGSSVGASAGSAGRGSHEVVRLREELEAIRSTVSWRVTAPLRALQTRRLREWR
jgi:hypothetical protein